LVRDCDGNTEYIEVKYIDLSTTAPLRDRFYRLKKQILKREECLPKGGKQRAYILFANAKMHGYTDEQIIDTVRVALDGCSVSVDIEISDGEVTDNGEN